MRPRRIHWAVLAFLCATWAAAACDATSQGQGQGANSVASMPFDAARAWTHLEKQVALGPRPSGSPANDKLKAYLEDELRAVGLAPVRESFRAKTPVDETEFGNVYADVEAAPRKDGKPAPLVILGSHFDTKRIKDFEFISANDAGSSTAVLLELARVLAAARGKGPVAYRLLFIDGEEAVVEWEGDDNCYGSRHHARALEKSGELARVKAFVLLDMVGDKELKLHTDTYSDAELQRIFFGAAKRIGLGAHVDGPRLEIRDDHLSFMNVGVKSVDLIDFSYGPNNQHWHHAADTLDNCSKASLDAIGRIVLAGLPELERWALK
ncbi:MAG: M28 family peptidase [Planctomycetota bacterium]|nr:MAG: M28 family peptidase [Planctomycetota bacterium]